MDPTDCKQIGGDPEYLMPGGYTTIDSQPFGKLTGRCVLKISSDMDLRRKMNDLGQYPVLIMQREDLEEEFKDDPKMLKKIRDADRSKLSYLAEKIGDSMMDQYWESIDAVVPEYLGD